MFAQIEAKIDVKIGKVLKNVEWVLQDVVEELIANPTGRPVADQVKVAPDWESVAELVSGLVTVPAAAD